MFRAVIDASLLAICKCAQLVIGNPGLSISEQQTQFSLWAIFAAPLLISADLRTIAEASREILLNKEIIAVNQDVLGRQGWCAEHRAFTRVWVRELLPSGHFISHLEPPLGSSDRWAVVLENSRTIFNAQHITFDPKRHLPKPSGGKMTENTFAVRDLIRRKDLGIFQGSFSVRVDESSVATLLIVLLWPNNTTIKDLK